MGWILPLLLVTLPQPEPPLGLMVTDRIEAGVLPFAALGLGDGGVGRAGVPARPLGRGQHQTPGGVLVQAQQHGVKLHFPSGAEVLFTPTGFLHLRSGEQVGPFWNGVELLLADGTALRLRADRSRMRRVEARQGGQAILLWDRKRPVRELTRDRPFAGPQLMVLGEGDAFYRAIPLGPLLAMQRALCKKEAAGTLPERHVVILGDALRESLRSLPQQFSRRAIDYPDASGIALVLARRAGEIIPTGEHRLRVTDAGTMRVAVGADFELSMQLPEVGPVQMSLHRGAEARVLVEWTIGPTTSLRMVRPAGGKEEDPRYYRSGLPVAELWDQITPLRDNLGDRKLAQEILKGMGATAVKTVIPPKAKGGG